ncbi:MAG: zinc-binding alcohol dehydrogenase family protein [Propionicimonas sp.]|uniref:zinc-binding alcohol dehydrogenase family protein n=1 Tax=Propionicimonas sp. TaxID=1955623 RepID=UPI003D0DBDE1
MRAVVMTAPGADPTGGTFAEPEPRPGEDVLELVGAGVHQVVRSRASGAHYSSAGLFPNVPGVDAVARTADGRLVYTGWIRPPWGTMAERMAARAGIDLPEGADPLAVAAGVNPAMSGWFPLAKRHQEAGGLGTVLVIGATGMSGRLAVQSAFALGADRVVAAGRDAGRLEEVAALGAVPVSLSGDAASALADALAGERPSIVLDYVWGPAAEAAFDALNRSGFDEDGGIETVYTQIGGLAGRLAAVPADLLRSRPIRIVGSGIGAVSNEELLAGLPGLIGLIADGTLRVPYTPFAIEDAAAAWAHTGDRAVIVP